ncbi:MAG: methionine biosynthesis protein MetW [Hyphomonadaceae bacterium]|nr:methionine biosynthesis protein MetW [Hyphomonadaceae bacterium]
MAALTLVQPLPPAAVEPTALQAAVALLIKDGARVLDVGCGDGALITLLTRERNARARGIEVDPQKVLTCVRRGLSVVQGDPEHSLADFPARSFDYVVLSHALLGMRDPQRALRAAAGAGERVIVSIDNAGHWRTRLRHVASGRLQTWRSDAFCTVRDFVALARAAHLNVERATPIGGGRHGAPFARVLWRANWFAEQAVFLLAP